MLKLHIMMVLLKTIYFKDKDGVLRFDNATGEPVDLKAKGEEGKIKFDSAEIFALVETPNVEEAKTSKR